MRIPIIPVIVGLSVIATSCSNGDQMVRQFISHNMPASTYYYPKDTLGHLSLPKPFSVPTIGGMFQDLYYWDTYYTNLALLSMGNVEQARNNVDDILYLIERFGYMPNSSNLNSNNRSQPPYASMMVRDVYEQTEDKEWLMAAYNTLLKEYRFWMTYRMTESGLNRHFNMGSEEYLTNFYTYLQTRIPSLRDDVSPLERIRIASQFLSEAESGWDFTPRFNTKCEEFNPIDLNANLYIYEKNFAWMSYQLEIEGGKQWERTASRRLALINEYCYDNDSGLYYDYNYVTHTRSTVYSAAIFNLLWAGIPDAGQARNIVDNLPRLEAEYGIVACEEGIRSDVYQWDSPNAWPSCNVLAIAGLDKYGYRKDAARIARKYVDSSIRIFRETGNLWEKYNAVKGNLEVNEEYKMSPFMGWTAGAYLYASDYLINLKQYRI